MMGNEKLVLFGYAKVSDTKLNPMGIVTNGLQTVVS
jgi:hypothetical protein